MNTNIISVSDLANAFGVVMVATAELSDCEAGKVMSSWVDTQINYLVAEGCAREDAKAHMAAAIDMLYRATH